MKACIDYVRAMSLVDPKRKAACWIWHENDAGVMVRVGAWLADMERWNGLLLVVDIQLRRHHSAQGTGGSTGGGLPNEGVAVRSHRAPRG
jgi:hypothetical protein